MSRPSSHEAYRLLEAVRQGLLERLQRCDWLPADGRAHGEALERELWDAEERLLGREPGKPQEAACATC